MKKVFFIIIFTLAIVIVVLYVLAENIKLTNVREKVCEKYEDEIEIISIEKSWKLSGRGYDHFVICARNKIDGIIFQINHETLANDYAKNLFTAQLHKEIYKITREVFGEKGQLFKVEVLGKSLDDIPSKTSVTYSEYMEIYTEQVYCVIHIDGYERNYFEEKEIFLQKIKQSNIIYDYISLYFVDTKCVITGRKTDTNGDEHYNVYH